MKYDSILQEHIRGGEIVRQHRSVQRKTERFCIVVPFTEDLKLDLLGFRFVELANVEEQLDGKSFGPTFREYQTVWKTVDLFNRGKFDSGVDSVFDTLVENITTLVIGDSEYGVCTLPVEFINANRNCEKKKNWFLEF